MKIIDIQRFINNVKMIFESTPLTHIRKSIMGKGNPIKINDEDYDWYSNNKDELLKVLNMIVGPDASNDLKVLSNFNTTKYFTEGKPQKLKPKELKNALTKQIHAINARKVYSGNKLGTAFSSQYEKMEMENGVEVYAVYTPTANIILSHRELKTDTCETPTWCIASPNDANIMWNHYNLYESDYPAVFIVAQKLKNGDYNDMKYELKCNPLKTKDFANGKIALKELVDEWRDPQQNEKSMGSSSLFKVFNIKRNDLSSVIKKLMTSEKGKSFSEKYGKEMILNFRNKIDKSENDDERIKFLISSCQNGTFSNFYDKVKDDEKDFFIERLMEYNNLYEMDIMNLGVKINEKILNFLIKNKRCTNETLSRASEQFGEKEAIRVYLSMDDEVINYFTYKYFKDVDKIIDVSLKYNKINSNLLSICHYYKPERYDEVFGAIVSSNKSNNDLLNKLLDKRKDPKYIEECLENIIQNNRANNKTVEILKGNRILLNDSLNDKMDKIFENIIKNKKHNNETYILATKIKKHKYGNIILKELLKDDKVNYDTLDIASFYEASENRISVCDKIIKNLIKRNKINTKLLGLVCRKSYLEKYVPKLTDFLASKNKFGLKEMKLLVDCGYSEMMNKSLKYLLDYCKENNENIHLTFSQFLDNASKEADRKTFNAVVEACIKNDCHNAILLKCVLFKRTITTAKMDYLIKSLIKDKRIDNSILGLLIEYQEMKYILPVLKEIFKLGWSNYVTLEKLVDGELGDEIISYAIKEMYKNKTLSEYCFDIIFRARKYDLLHDLLKCFFKMKLVNFQVLNSVLATKDEKMIKETLNFIFKNKDLFVDKDKAIHILEVLLRMGDKKITEKFLNLMKENGSIDGHLIYKLLRANEEDMASDILNYLYENDKLDFGALVSYLHFSRNHEEIIEKIAHDLINKNIITKNDIIERLQRSPREEIRALAEKIKNY